jgi:DNA-binding MarR family transcriptional regulator
MSSSERFVREYVGDPKLVDLLKAILDINQYEALTLIALALTNESIAPRIADVTGIPRSKIYLTISSLEKKKLVEKQKDGYRSNAANIVRLQGITEDLTKNFQKFVEKLAAYSGAPSKTVGIISEVMKRVLTQNGYHISKPESVKHYITMNTDRYYRFLRYSNAERYLSKIDPRSREELLQKLSPTNIEGIVEFVGESSTSGAKVSTIILTKEKLDMYKELTYLAIATASEYIGCEASIVAVLPEIDSNKMGAERMDSEAKIHLVSANETDFEEKITSILVDLDKNWRDSKRELDNISSEIMDLKRMLTSTLDNTYTLNRAVRESAGKYGKRYQEIMNRIETDLVNSDDLLSNIRNEYERLSERLESHRRFPNAVEIKAIKDKTSVLRESVQRKIQALDQLSEDLTSYLRGEKKYAKYGFSINPFVFTVPDEYPDRIVNQVQAQEKLNSFALNMTQGSIRNFLFLVASEGMGKTHTLNYFAKKVNDGKFGKALALRLNCRPKSDIIDLYPQITHAISSSSTPDNFKQEVTHILEASGVPKSATDFLRVLREINTTLITLGYKGVFLMIDDFENTLPTEETSITPRSVLQLGDLAKLENIGFTVAVREEYWKIWHTEIKRRLTKVTKTDIVALTTFTDKETLELIEQRLSEYKEPEAKKLPTFSLSVVTQICKAANGVPRNIVAIAREVFRLSVSGEREITPELFKEVTS